MAYTINHRNLLIFMWMVQSTCFCKAQVTLEQNMYQINDMLERQQINPSTITECPDALADLQFMEAINADNVEHMEWGTDSLIAIDYGGMQKFRLKGDSLLLIGRENRLMHIDYSLPEAWLRFPMSLGDSIGGLFEGKGQYCERLFLRKAGRYSTKADAIGSLVMENSDTLHQVLRLRTERITTTLAQPLDSMLAAYGTLDSIPPLGNDSIITLMSTDGKAIRTVTLRYYALGCRYPVLETCQTRNIAESSSPVQTAAYYSSPYSQEGLASANRSLPGTREQGPASSAGNDDQYYSYSLDTNASAQTINVSYSISGDTVKGDVPIRLLLCNHQGILFRQASGNLQSRGQELLSVSYAGLHQGTYVIYIEFGDQQYSEKLNVN